MRVSNITQRRFWHTAVTVKAPTHNHQQCRQMHPIKVSYSFKWTTTTHLNEPIHLCSFKRTQLHLNEFTRKCSFVVAAFNEVISSFNSTLNECSFILILYELALYACSDRCVLMVSFHSFVKYDCIDPDWFNNIHFDDYEWPINLKTPYLHINVKIIIGGNKVLWKFYTF